MASRIIGAIIGIEVVNGQTKYNAILAKIAPKEGQDRQYNWIGFNCHQYSETDMLRVLNAKGCTWLNVKLENGAIKGSAGDLKRFSNVKYDGDTTYRPVVILSEMINCHNNKVVAYKVARHDGHVFTVRIGEMLKRGNRGIKYGFTPVQNAIFVPATDDKPAYYKSYPNCPFLKEMTASGENPVADNRRINTKNNQKIVDKEEAAAKSNNDKLRQFTPEQIRQLKLGKEHKVNYLIYANPKLSALQMKVLRCGLETKVNVRPFAHPEYTVDAMRYYILELQTGMNIKPYLSPKYSIAQIAELSIATSEGLDISKMCDPDLSVRQMCERRIRLENNMFYESDVNREGSWI